LHHDHHTFIMASNRNRHENLLSSIDHAVSYAFQRQSWYSMRARNVGHSRSPRGRCFKVELNISHLQEHHAIFLSKALRQKVLHIYSLDPS
jgi:hypothetical protein